MRARAGPASIAAPARARVVAVRAHAGAIAARARARAGAKRLGAIGTLGVPWVPRVVWGDEVAFTCSFDQGPTFGGL